MSLAYWTVTHTIKSLTRVLCRIEGRALNQVPPNGPLILVSNHINFIEVPLVYTHLQPRPVTGFVKSETWDSRWLGPLFDLWGGIPIRRGVADMTALRKGVEALQANKIVAIAPEGTRSGDGKLQKGHPGVVTLARLSGVPLLPLAYYGGEAIYRNMRRLRRTDFYFKVGQPFYLDTGSARVTRQVRQQITDEIMYQLAALLPSQYRGVYADLENATAEFLRF